ncbi:MAG: hypothetical protein LBM74_06130 [Oscillospiraceae bacterium]|jgi:hypothetical protein|nr:hypothetical protein [Oscillospiraceae bacterium]
MGKGNRSNALLVELLMAVLFFALSATVILNVFAATHEQSTGAGIMNRALTEAENLAERLYAAESAEERLLSEAFIATGDGFEKTFDEFVITVTLQEVPAEAGILREIMIIARRGEAELLALPCAKYLPGEVIA